MRERLSSKIAAAKARNPKLFGHIEREGKFIRGVRDRRSGVPLQAMQVVDEKVVNVNGKRVTQQRVELRPTAAYAEMTIEMDDGSAHQTIVSQAEAKRDWTVEELTDLYTADLEEWAKEGMSDDLLDRYAARTPVKVVR